MKPDNTVEENKIADGATIKVSIKKAQAIETKEIQAPEINAKPVDQNASTAQQQQRVPDGGFNLNPMEMMKNPEFMKMMMQNPLIK